MLCCLLGVQPFVLEFSMADEEGKRRAMVNILERF
jgi:hypothetical protein